MNKTFRKTLVVIGTIAIFVALKFAAQEYWKYINTPFFQTRGVVLFWDDVNKPEKLDWIKLCKDANLNTISVYAHDNVRQQEDYRSFLERCKAEGLHIDYEEHAISILLPRTHFAEHPEWFRMDENGVRVADANCCPSSEEALEVIAKNAKKVAKLRQPTNHKHFFWLDDGRPVCQCEKCKELSPSDQALIIENRIIKALREEDPEAMLAHLCYDNTLQAPTKIKAEEGVFLQFAPFYRSWDHPLSEREARREGQKLTHGDYLDALAANLKVFPKETAQVLEYWMDVSLFSGWSKPQKRLKWNREVFLKDLETYASFGIHHIMSYAAFIDADYMEMFGDVSFVGEYGSGLHKYREY